MQTASIHRSAQISASILMALVTAVGHTQTLPLEAPQYQATDPNGVDVLSGTPIFHLTDLTIGSSAHPLEHTLHITTAILLSGNGAAVSVSTASIDNYFGYVIPAGGGFCGSSYPGAATFQVAFGGSSELFYANGSGYLPCNGGSSTLTSSHVYTKGDGTVINLGGGNPLVTYPDGRTVSIYTKSVVVSPWNQYFPSQTLYRVQSVVRNDGLQLKFNYASNSTPTYQNYGNWTMPTSVTAINNAFDYCDPAADSCYLSYQWPSATYAYVTGPNYNTLTGSTSTFTVTDDKSQTTRFSMDRNFRVTGVKLPSSSSADNLTYNYCNSACYITDGVTTTYFANMIYSVVRDGTTWRNYYAPTTTEFSFSFFNTSFPYGAPTDAIGATLASTVPPQFHFAIAAIGTLDGTSYRFDPMSYSGRVTSVVKPEGNTATYAYDGRGNVTGITDTPKAGSPLAVTTLSASYPTTCTNIFTCNEPTWIKDALGNETDYTYDPNHGGTLTVTAPPDPNGIRPQTRYSYTQRYAWVKNSAGVYVHAATPIWVVTSKSICRKGAAAASGVGCALANDEVITSYQYGPDSGPNNLILRGEAITADGVTLLTCYGYDERGNIISETRPNGNSGVVNCP